MQPNSRTYDSSTIAPPAHGARQVDTADDYIDLLVQQIVGAAGVADAGAPTESATHVDLLQAHIEQLRNERPVATDLPAAVAHVEEPEPVADTPPPVRHRPRSVTAPALAPMVEVEPIHPDRQWPSAEPAIASRTSVRPRSESVQKRVLSHRSDVDEVILQALAASDSSRHAAGESQPPERGRSFQPPKGGNSRLPLVMAIILLLIGGSMVIVGQSFYANIRDLLENYWIEVPAENVDVSSLVPPDDSPVRVTYKPLVAEPPQAVATVAPEQADALLPNDLTATRRTVKTYRVGSDGKIIFVPRAGS